MTYMKSIINYDTNQGINNKCKMYRSRCAGTEAAVILSKSQIFKGCLAEYLMPSCMLRRMKIGFENRDSSFGNSRKLVSF